MGALYYLFQYLLMLLGAFNKRLTVRFILFPVIQGASNGGKALKAGDDHIVGAEGTVDD